MNDPFIHFLLYRFIERVAAILAGTLAIYLGYKLFRLGIFPEQEAVIETGDVKISLSRVGPGIFFTLFGTVLLGYVTVDHPTLEKLKTIGLQTESEQAVSPTPLQSYTTETLVAGIKSERLNETERLSSSINTFSDALERLNQHHINPNDLELVHAIRTLNRSYNELSAIKHERLFELYQAGDCDSLIETNSDTCIRLKEIEESRL